MIFCTRMLKIYKVKELSLGKCIQLCNATAAAAKTVAATALLLLLLLVLLLPLVVVSLYQ